MKYKCKEEYKYKYRWGSKYKHQTNFESRLYWIWANNSSSLYSGCVDSQRPLCGNCWNYQNMRQCPWFRHEIIQAVKWHRISIIQSRGKWKSENAPSPQIQKMLSLLTPLISSCCCASLYSLFVIWKQINVCTIYSSVFIFSVSHIPASPFFFLPRPNENPFF